MAVILKNNKPKYILVDFEEYDELQAMSKLYMNLSGAHAITNTPSSYSWRRAV